LCPLSVYVGEAEYEQDGFVDKEGGKVLYSVRDEYDIAKEALVLSIGVLGKENSGEFNMVNMLNSQLLTTLLRITRPSMSAEAFNSEFAKMYAELKPYWRRLVVKYENL
jgi:hypothetical protein